MLEKAKSILYQLDNLDPSIKGEQRAFYLQEILNNVWHNGLHIREIDKETDWSSI